MFFTVFGKKNCPYCVRAKEVLRSKMLEFTYKDVVEDEVFFMQMDNSVKAATGKSAETVPQIFVDDRYIGGYDELVEYFNQQEDINPSDFLGEL